MNNTELFLSQLKGFHLQCLALAQTIENILEIAERPTEETPGEKKPEPCRHPIPMRIPAPAMGHPHRFRCGACKEEVELEVV